VGASHFYSSGKSRCRPHLTWTRARRFELMGYIGQGMSDGEIAGVMGVSRDAVKLARRRYGIRGVSAQAYSCRQVADMMGVGCSKTVRAWIRARMLRGHRAYRQGPNRTWRISRDDLWAFMADARTWHLWTVDRIVDDKLRGWAILCGRHRVRFLTPREAAQRLYVEPSTINQWIHKGWLRARRWGNWWIDERDVATFQHPAIGGSRAREAA
jgi:excisionase family DNA binding protein